jgi:NADPH:quinone reductase-like Zn-dependent oxidoreductase
VHTDTHESGGYSNPAILPLEKLFIQMKKLTNKTASISGGTSGIGLATAQEFIKEGAHVIITSRRSETLNQTAASLGSNAFGIA